MRINANSCSEQLLSSWMSITHAPIEEDIYLEQPEGFEETSYIGDKLVS